MVLLVIYLFNNKRCWHLWLRQEVATFSFSFTRGRERLRDFKVQGRKSARPDVTPRGNQTACWRRSERLFSCHLSGGSSCLEQWTLCFSSWCSGVVLLQGWKEVPTTRGLQGDGSFQSCLLFLGHHLLRELVSSVVWSTRDLFLHLLICNFDWVYFLGEMVFQLLKVYLFIHKMVFWI